MGERSESLVRQKAIKDILGNERIKDQKQLVQRLLDKFKIETNQTVVSRELRKMGVTKKQEGEDLIYDLPQTDITIEILKLAIIDIVHNESTIVLKTLDGMAAFVGDWLDEQKDLRILGTIAGENVVFVAPVTVKELSKLTDLISEKMFFKNKLSGN